MTAGTVSVVEGVKATKAHVGAILVAGSTQINWMDVGNYIADGLSNAAAHTFLGAFPEGMHDAMARVLVAGLASGFSWLAIYFTRNES